MTTSPLIERYSVVRVVIVDGRRVDVEIRSSPAQAMMLL
jgi:hypothetical protein